MGQHAPGLCLQETSSMSWLAALLGAGQMKPVDCCTAGDAVVHRPHLLSSGLKPVLYLSSFTWSLFETFIFFLYGYIYIYTHIYIGYTAQLTGFSFPDQGSNPCPKHWKHSRNLGSSREFLGYYYPNLFLGECIELAREEQLKWILTISNKPDLLIKEGQAQTPLEIKYEQWVLLSGGLEYVMSRALIIVA